MRSSHKYFRKIIYPNDIEFPAVKFSGTGLSKVVSV